MFGNSPSCNDSVPVKLDCRLLYKVGCKPIGQHTSIGIHSVCTTTGLAKLPLCSCYVALMLRQPCRMLRSGRSHPSDSLQLDIIVIIRTPIYWFVRTYPVTGSLAAYTR